MNSEDNEMNFSETAVELLAMAGFVNECEAILRTENEAKERLEKRAKAIAFDMVQDDYDAEANGDEITVKEPWDFRESHYDSFSDIMRKNYGPFANFWHDKKGRLVLVVE